MDKHEDIPLSGGPEMQPMHLCLLEDISMRKAIEESLTESERSKAVLLSIFPEWHTGAITIRTGRCGMPPTAVWN